MRSASKDLYGILGLARDASESDIKKAYRRLARKYHPDVNQEEPGAEAKFKEATQAYEILSDPDKRRQYDQFGQVGREGGFGTAYGADFGFENLFDMFFSDAGAQTSARRRSSSQPGADLLVGLAVTLEEAARGVEKVVTLTKPSACKTCGGSGAAEGTGTSTCPLCHGSGMVQTARNTVFGSFTAASTCTRCAGSGQILTQPCQTCGGEGRIVSKEKVKVKVPPGVDTGTRLRLTGKGETGRRGGPTGDLYVDLEVRRHKFFERRGSDIYMKMPVGMVQATVGTQIEVPTLWGTQQLKVPPGTQPGATFELKGEGMPHLGRKGRGRQMVEVEVRVPKNLTDKQRKLLEDFSVERGEEDSLMHESLIDRIKGAFGG